MKRLSFVAPPFAGHFNPLLQLALAARGAGFDIEFITGPRKFPILRNYGIEAVPLPSIGEDTLESIANTAQRVGSNPFRLLAQFRQNLRLLPAIGEELDQHWREQRPAVVIADSVAPIAGLVADRQRIPWITTIATPFSLETRRGTPSYCGGWMPPTNAWERMRDAAGRAAIRGFKLGVGRLFRRELTAMGLRGVYRSDGAEAIYSPYAILGFGLRELEFDRDWPAQFHMTGPAIASPEPVVDLQLPEARPRVLVTHGTHLLWARKALLEETAALSKDMPHVQFVVSLGDPTAAAPRAGRVEIHPFVPYQSDLQRFDAVIHHGGAGVTYASILAGVPSLAVPRDYDQFDYAARIVHHGLGLRAARIAGTADAVTRLLDRSQWPALERFRAYARAYNPQSVFLETVRRVSQSL